MISGSGTYQLTDGRLVPIERDAALTMLAQQPAETMVWFDMLRPTVNDLAPLAKQFNWHPTVTESLRVGRQRPKYQRFDGYDYLVLYAAVRHPEAREVQDQLTICEVGIILGEQYIVTATLHKIPELDEIKHRWQSGEFADTRHTVGFLLYTIADDIVDGYFPALDQIEDRIDDIEETIFRADTVATIDDVFTLRRELLTLRKVVAPERDLFNLLVRTDGPVRNRELIPYLMEVYDHLLRVVDLIDTYRDLLNGTLDGFVSVQSNNLNKVVNRLTSASIILMSVTLVAGIYGMNFVNMPELEWQYGYPFAIGLMVLIASGLFVFFRRKGWI